MKKTISILTACLIVLFLSSGLVSASADGKIKKIQFDSPSADEDRVTFMLDGAHLPKMFALKGDRPRVVFDFPNTFPVKGVQNTIKADGTFIKRIRSGIHTGANPKTRIVFDLNPGKEIDFEQNFDQDTNTLVIRVFEVGTQPGPMMKEQEQVAAKVPDETVAEAPAQEKPAPKKQAEQEEVETVRSAALSDTATGTKPETEAVPEPEQQVVDTPESEAAKPEQQAAGILESEAVEPEMAMEESTVIQPLSEIGDPQKQPAAKPSSPILYSIEFDDNSNRGEMIMFKLNEFYPPVVFGIEEDIPRIVCFFKGTRAGEDLKDVIESNGQHVKTIRVGKYQNPDNIRVVLDLVPDKNYDLQQIFFKDDNLFMIIINATGDKVSG